MNVTIVNITNSPIEEWNAALKACPHATYFHSYEWAKIWQQYQGLVPRAKKIEFSDGMTLILPCSYIPVQKGLIKYVVMSPRGTFGGALYNGKLTQDHLKLVCHEIKKFSWVKWRQNPYEPLLQSVWPAESRKDVTHAINLGVGFEVVHKNWARCNGSLARKVRKALKAGITVRVGKSKEDWLKYYEAYQASLVRWADTVTSRYDWGLFHLFYDRQSAHIKLWLAELNGKLTAGAICFYQNRHVVYWHGAAHEQYFNLRPVNLLHFEIIKDACESGYEWYDFNPSGGHKGVAKFKKSFGCQTYKSNILIYKSVPTKFIEFIRKT